MEDWAVSYWWANVSPSALWEKKSMLKSVLANSCGVNSDHGWFKIENMIWGVWRQKCRNIRAFIHCSLPRSAKHWVSVFQLHGISNEMLLAMRLSCVGIFLAYTLKGLFTIQGRRCSIRRKKWAQELWESITVSGAVSYLTNLQLGKLWGGGSRCFG